MSRQTQNNASDMKRFFEFVLFRVVPVFLILGILWFGSRVAIAIFKRIDEQIEAGQRRTAYIETATAIAPANATPQPTEVSAGGNRTAKVGAKAARVPFAQGFVTNTPPAGAITLPPTNTPQPQPAVAATPVPLPTLLLPPNPAADTVAPTAIPTRVDPIPRDYELVNIALLGVDRELNNDTFIRTDTMIIVSANRDTGTVALLSLPRDLYVYVPGWTMQRLNLAYTWGEANGWTDGGFGLLRQTIFYNLGINVHHFALVDFSDVREIVDTVGGIDITVDCAIQDYPLIGADVPQVAHLASEDDNLYTLPVGFYHLNGGEALWYARSRRNSDDFDRGRRQQQVIRAVWRRALDTGQLASLPQLWSQGLELVETDVGFDTMLSLLPIALNLDTRRIENFTLRRWFHTTPWTTPDGANVQLPNPDELRTLLVDFYQPPTENQLFTEGARIAVFNGTENADWDIVAAARLGWDGLNAFAGGAADRADYANTVLIDHTGQSKGSSLDQIARVLNVRPDNIRVEPDANRSADFEIILGNSYNSCTENVLPVDG